MNPTKQTNAPNRFGVKAQDNENVLLYILYSNILTAQHFDKQEIYMYHFNYSSYMSYVHCSNLIEANQYE